MRSTLRSAVRAHRLALALAVPLATASVGFGISASAQPPPAPATITPHAPPIGPDGRPLPRRQGLAPVAPPPGASPHGAAPHDAAEHAAGEHEEGPRPVNWTDFSNKDQPPYAAALINFAILMFIYFYYGKAPIAAALKARREGVSKQIEEAQKIKREAEARSKQYASKLEDLDQDLESAKAALVAAGAGEKARIVREAEEKAARMEKDAEFLLEQERKQLRQELQREAVAAALAAAEEMLRTKMTVADQERIAEEYLTTLVPAKAGAGASRGAS